MRFIKDLIAWKQQAATEIDDLRPLTRRPEIGPLIPPRARADQALDDDADHADDDEVYEDEELFADEEYDALDEDLDDEDAEADPPSPVAGPPPADALTLAAARNAAQEGETYDLLSRVVRNSAPPPKAEPAPVPAAAAMPAVEDAPARPVHRPAKIWNITPGTPARRPETSLPAEPAPDAAPADDAPAAPAPAPRAKTRLLGFHLAGMDADDPFGAQLARPQGSVNFPTGWLVVVEGPGRGASFTLAEGVNQIGRGDDQAVRLDFGDTSISRNNHASLAFDPDTGKFFLGHGGKSNIVRLNGRPVLSTEELSDNDLIKIGETVMRFVGFCDRNFSWDDRKAGSADAQAG